MTKKLNKYLLILLFAVRFAFHAPSVDAVSEYKIESFKAKIVLEKDTDLLVTEEIVAFFNVQKHGIFRIVPVTYSARGRTINADFELLKVTDENGNQIPVEVSNFGRSV